MFLHDLIRSSTMNVNLYVHASFMDRLKASVSKLEFIWFLARSYYFATAKCMSKGICSNPSSL